jgi:hypothetical protein
MGGLSFLSLSRCPIQFVKVCKSCGQNRYLSHWVWDTLPKMFAGVYCAGIRSPTTVPGIVATRSPSGS